MRHAVRTPEGRIALPLDTFVRIMGRWHLGAQEHCPVDKEYKALWEMGVKLFPAATDWSQGRYLSHTVLSSPDGLPVAGASGMPGLHLSIAAASTAPTSARPWRTSSPTASSDARTPSPNASPGRRFGG